MKEPNVFSYGNRKLPRSTAIFNITPAFDCPAQKLGMCDISNICYAKKAERLYPQVRTFRARQTEFWDRCTVTEFISRLESPKLLRFNESGDFRNQDDVDKVSDIADKLKKQGIKVYAYTARFDLDFSFVSSNLTIVGSKFMVHNCFIPVSKEEMNYKIEKARSDGYKTFICKANCKICDVCSKRLRLHIFALKH